MWLTLLGMPSHLASQEPSSPVATLTLQEAMHQARQRAREISAAQAHLVAREAQVDLARSFRLPRVSLSEIWIHTDSPADVFGLELTQERFSFPAFVASDPNRPDPLTHATTQLEVEVPIYLGGELSARLRQAELAASAAGDGLRRTADEAAFAAAEAFVQLAQSREQVALLERSLEAVRAHVALARSYVAQGMLVTSEVLRAEVEEARVTDLLTAARGQAEVARAALAFRLAFDLDRQWRLQPLATPEPQDLDLAHWLRNADQRPDLLAARRMEEVAALEETVSKAAKRPRIGLRGRYVLADDRPFGSHGDHFALTAMASLDLYAGGRHRAALSAAEARSAAMASEVERFRAAVHLEVRQAFSEAVSAQQRCLTSHAAVAAARETARIVEERFRQGVVKTVDLLDATTSRREAEGRELTARSDAYRSRLRLALAAGQAPEAGLASLLQGLQTPQHAPTPGAPTPDSPDNAVTEPSP